MSEELPKYLKMLSGLKYRCYFAQVKPDNIASKKLLEKNKFIKLATTESGTEIYIFAPKIMEQIGDLKRDVLNLVTGNNL